MADTYKVSEKTYRSIQEAETGQGKRSATAYFSPRVGCDLRYETREPDGTEYLNEITSLYLEAPDPAQFIPPDAPVSLRGFEWKIAQAANGGGNVAAMRADLARVKAIRGIP